MALLGQLTVGILGDMSGYSDSLTAAQKQTVKFTKGMEKMGRDISTVGYGFKDLGGKLTKSVTAPALVAATAIGGITAALGWGRLKSVDAAQAQLKGLGYEAEDVERISGQLSKALEGGMLTMGEATSAAATAMAGGVKEGKELTRYIQILDGTVAGSTGTFQEMEQIFGRIVDQGNITRNEFDMIAQRMPGFSKAVQDNMKISSDEMYEMLRNGEITTDQFLDIMEDFSGDMATEYAKSWDGMVKNTKAYIGIIGENLLGGVFEESKEAIASFIEVLSSESVIDWAGNMGETIGNTFTKVVEKVKELKQSYDELSPGIQNVIKKLAIFGSIGAVAIGPILMLIGTLIVTVGTLITRFGAIAGAVTQLGGVMAILTGPIGIVIGVIASLIAIGVLLWKNWETVKEKAHTVFSSFAPLLEIVKGAFNNLLSSVSPIMDSLKILWQSLIPLLKTVGAIIAAVVVPAFGILVSVFSAVIAAIGPIINAFVNLVDFVVNAVNLLIAVLTGDFAGALDFWNAMTGNAIGFFKSLWDGVVSFFVTFITTIINFFKNLYMVLVGNSIIPDMVNAIVLWFKNMFTWVINLVKNIVDGVVKVFNKMKTIATKIFTALWEIIKSVWDYIKNTFTNALDFLLALVTGDFQGMKQAMQNQMENAKNLLSNIWGSIKKLIGEKAVQILTNIVNKFTEMKNGMQNKINSAKNAVVNKFTGMATSVSSKVSGIVSAVRTKFNDIKNKITNPIKSAKDTIGGYISNIKGFFSNLRLRIPKPKFPKISISKGTKSFFGASVPYPKFSVSWNALGGIFTKPTVLNTASGLQGFGEVSGESEAVIPLNKKNLGGIGEGIAALMNTNDDALLQATLEQNKILMQLLNKNQDIVINDRVLGTVAEPVVTEIQNRNKGINNRFE